MEDNGLSFEEAFGILEQTVRDLESGVLSIEESVKLFERGMAMTRLCGAKLDAAQLRVNRLIQIGDGELALDEIELA